MKGLGKLFGAGGGETPEQRKARQAQLRSQRAAAEDAARARAEESASGRALRGIGRRALAFQGVETGLATTLAG